MIVSIRRGASADLNRIVELWQESLEFHMALDSRFNFAPDAARYWSELIVERLDDSHWCILVAEKENSVIAFIMGYVQEMGPIYREKQRGFITDIAVTETQRHKGIGSQLCGEAIKWFREQGATVIEVSSAITNSVSQAFWRKMGFKDFLIQMQGDLR